MTTGQPARTILSLVNDTGTTAEAVSSAIFGTLDHIAYVPDADTGIAFGATDLLTLTLDTGELNMQLFSVPLDTNTTPWKRFYTLSVYDTGGDIVSGVGGLPALAGEKITAQITGGVSGEQGKVYIYYYG